MISLMSTCQKILIWTHFPIQINLLNDKSIHVWAISVMTVFSHIYFQNICRNIIRLDMAKLPSDAPMYLYIGKSSEHAAYKRSNRDQSALFPLCSSSVYFICAQEACHRSLASCCPPKYSPAVSLTHTNTLQILQGGSQEGCRVHGNRVALSYLILLRNPHVPQRPQPFPQRL